MTCHAHHCTAEATHRVRLSKPSSPTQWTSGLDYCGSHAGTVAANIGRRMNTQVEAL